MALPCWIAHGHPEEECQQKLTCAQSASSGEVHSPTGLRSPVQSNYAAMRRVGKVFPVRLHKQVDFYNKKQENYKK